MNRYVLFLKSPVKKYIIILITITYQRGVAFTLKSSLQDSILGFNWQRMLLARPLPLLVKAPLMRNAFTDRVKAFFAFDMIKNEMRDYYVKKNLKRNH